MCCGFSPMIYLSDLLDYINIRILKPTHSNLDDSCSGAECAGWQRGEKSLTGIKTWLQIIWVFEFLSDKSTKLLRGSINLSFILIENSNPCFDRQC